MRHEVNKNTKKRLKILLIVTVCIALIISLIVFIIVRQENAQEVVLKETILELQTVFEETAGPHKLTDECVDVYIGGKLDTAGPRQCYVQLLYMGQTESLAEARDVMRVFENNVTERGFVSERSTAFTYSDENLFDREGVKYKFKELPYECLFIYSYGEVKENQLISDFRCIDSSWFTKTFQSREATKFWTYF